MISYEVTFYDRVEDSEEEALERWKDYILKGKEVDVYNWLQTCDGWNVCSLIIFHDKIKYELNVNIFTKKHNELDSSTRILNTSYEHKIYGENFIVCIEKEEKIIYWANTHGLYTIDDEETGLPNPSFNQNCLIINKIFQSETETFNDKYFDPVRKFCNLLQKIESKPND